MQNFLSLKGAANNQLLQEQKKKEQEEQERQKLKQEEEHRSKDEEKEAKDEDDDETQREDEDEEGEDEYDLDESDQELLDQVYNWNMSIDGPIEHLQPVVEELKENDDIGACEYCSGSTTMPTTDNT